MNYCAKNNRKGFTLVETIVALAVGTICVVSVLLITTKGLQRMREIRRTERLHASAVFLADTFSYWVRQSEFITPVTSSDVTLKLFNGSEKEIKRSVDKILLDSRPITGEDIEVTNLQFQYLERSVQFTYTIKSKEAGETITITSAAALRKPL